MNFADIKAAIEYRKGFDLNTFYQRTIVASNMVGD